MPATLQGMRAASLARAAVSSIIENLGENITLMRAITETRESFTPEPDPEDSSTKQDLDAFEFANQREDQETALAAPEVIRCVRSRIQEALEALDVAGVVSELPDSMETQIILVREQDIPENSVFEWYDWALTHASPNKLLLEKITADSTAWDEFTSEYTPEEIATALFNIENNFWAIFRSLQSLMVEYGIMKKVDMFVVDKNAVNDPPVAMLYYVVPWEEPADS